MFNFELGNYVTDQSTGFKGVIDGRAIWNTGNIQYSVRPKVSEEGKLPDSIWIDGDHLVVKAANNINSEYTDPRFKFDNGDQVKALLFDFKGTIVGQVQWLNGCLEYSVLCKKLDKENLMIFKVIAEQEITLVKAKAVPIQKRETGGPMKSAMRSECRA